MEDINKDIENLTDIINLINEELDNKDKNVSAILDLKDLLSLRNLIKAYKELEEYKKIAELTQISCCTAQNCGALNNSIKNALENMKLKEKIKELEEFKKQVTEIENTNFIKYKNYIPVSLVEEKIEELKHKDFIAIQVCSQHDNKALAQIEVLQELLEKRK